MQQRCRGLSDAPGLMTSPIYRERFKPGALGYLQTMLHHSSLVLGSFDRVKSFHWTYRPQTSMCQHEGAGSWSRFDPSLFASKRESGIQSVTL